MPLNDDAYTIPASGHVYTAPRGTAIPADLRTPGGAWEEPGHVGTEENDGVPEFPFDGGDVTTKGSWAKKAIRTIVAPETESINWSLSQIDRTTLGLYFGGTGGSTAGRFERHTTDANTKEHALLIVWEDGDEAFGVWYDSVSTKKADAISLADNENPVMLPVTSTVMDPLTGTLKSAWVSSTIGS